MAVIAFLLVVTGCTNKASKTSAPEHNVETKLYDKMSKNDRSDVQFTFKRHDGTIKGQTRIDVEIKNKSDKNVKLNLADIVYLGSDSLESDKTEKKTVKVNKSINIKGIFKDVDETIFNDPGLFCYRNDDFKLAYANGKTSKSSNLKDSELKKGYRHFMAHKDDVKKSSESLTVDDNDSNSSSDNTADDLSDTTTQGDDSTTSNSGNSINNGQEAMALVEKQNGPATGNEKYYFDDNLWDTNNGEVYWVVLSEPNPENPDIQTPIGSWMVYPDGSVTMGKPTDNQ